MKKTPRIFAGWDEWVWRSQAVKAMRIAWLDGWLMAERFLGSTEMKGIALVQIWEDIAPTPDRVPQIVQWINDLDWVNYLQEDTHHGKGYTARYVDDTQRDRRITDNESTWPEYLREHRDRWGVWIPRRVMGWLPTWDKFVVDRFDGYATDARRELLRKPFNGIPVPMFDRHTQYGRGLTTVLSGDGPGHKMLAAEVDAHGWAAVATIPEQIGPEAVAKHHDYLKQQRQLNLW